MHRDLTLESLYVWMNLMTHDLHLYLAHSVRRNKPLKNKVLACNYT